MEKDKVWIGLICREKQVIKWTAGTSKEAIEKWIADWCRGEWEVHMEDIPMPAENWKVAMEYFNKNWDDSRLCAEVDVLK